MNLSAQSRFSWLIGALLFAGAALFATGASVERNNDAHHDETSVSATIGEGTAAPEGSQAAESAEDPGAVETAATHTGVAEARRDEVLGINLESTPLVVIALIMSFVLAAATLRSNNRLILLTTAAFATVFAILDIAELSHQIDRSKTGLAVLAAIIAAIHASAALLATQGSLART